MHDMDELRKIDLNLLLTLHTLLTEKHVTRAARRLHRSQPAVSHALAQLRVHFNDPLLIRNNGRMTLSAIAQALLPPLESALHGLNSLVGSPQFDPVSTRRRFRLAMSDYAARILLPPLLVTLRQQAPGFDLAISQASREMMLAQLEEGEIDLALGVFPQAAGEILKEPLFTERFICLADKNALPADGTFTLDEWLARPHVMLAMVPDAVDDIDKALNARGLKRRICVTLPHWSAAVSLLPGTDLILTVASRSVASEHNDNILAQFKPPLALPEFEYELAWHSRKTADPAHQWLRRAIRESC